MDPSIHNDRSNSQSQRSHFDSPQQPVDSRIFNHNSFHGAQPIRNARSAHMNLSCDAMIPHGTQQVGSCQTGDQSYELRADGSTTQPANSTSMAASTSRKKWQNRKRLSKASQSARQKKSGKHQDRKSTPATFQGVQIPAGRAPAAASNQQFLGAELSNPKGYRRQPVRQAKVLQSVEHQIDPQNPCHSPYPWDDPLVSYANDLRRLSIHDGQDVSNTSPAHEHDTAYTPTNNFRESDMMGMSVSPSIKRPKTKKRKSGIPGMIGVIGQPKGAADIPERNPMPFSPQDRMTRELTAALESKTLRLNSMRMHGDGADVLPGNGADVYGAEIRALREEVNNLTQLLEKLLTGGAPVVACHDPQLRRVEEGSNNTSSNLANRRDDVDEDAPTTLSSIPSRENSKAALGRRSNAQAQRLIHTQRHPEDACGSANLHATNFIREESTLFISDTSSPQTSKHIRWPRHPESKNQPVVTATPVRSYQQVSIGGSKPSASSTSQVSQGQHAPQEREMNEVANFKSVQGAVDGTETQSEGRGHISRSTSELPDLETILSNSQALRSNTQLLAPASSSQSIHFRNSSLKSDTEPYGRDIRMNLQHATSSFSVEELPPKRIRNTDSTYHNANGAFADRGKLGNVQSLEQGHQSQDRPLSEGSRQRSTHEHSYLTLDPEPREALPTPNARAEHHGLSSRISNKSPQRKRRRFNAKGGPLCTSPNNIKIQSGRGYLGDTLATHRETLEAKEYQNVDETRNIQHNSSQAGKVKTSSTNISDDVVDEAFAFANTFLTELSDRRPSSQDCDHGTIPSHIFYGKDAPRPYSRPPPSLPDNLDDVDLHMSLSDDEQNRHHVTGNIKRTAENTAGPSMHSSMVSRTIQSAMDLPTPAPSSSPTKSRTPQVSQAKDSSLGRTVGPSHSDTTKKRKRPANVGEDVTSPSGPSRKIARDDGQAPEKTKKKKKKGLPKSLSHGTETHQAAKSSSTYEPNPTSSQPPPIPATPTHREKSIYRRHGTEPARSPLLSSPAAAIKRAAAHLSAQARTLKQPFKPTTTTNQSAPVESATLLQPNATIAKRKSKKPTAAEQQQWRPKLSRDVPHDLRKSTEELVEIGRKEKACQRHEAAPYAFRWNGRLFKEYHHLAYKTDASGNGWSNELRRSLMLK